MAPFVHDVTMFVFNIGLPDVSLNLVVANGVELNSIELFASITPSQTEISSALCGLGRTLRSDEECNVHVRGLRLTDEQQCTRQIARSIGNCARQNSFSCAAAARTNSLHLSGRSP